jgi:deoxyadenosine/deoxycytidine kinase
VGQIHKRGREYENSISIDYLSRLNERYEAWIHTYDRGKLLVIDVDNINFVDNPEDLGNIITKIDASCMVCFRTIFSTNNINTHKIYASLLEAFYLYL